MEKRERAQIILLPECVEDYIDEGAPVQVIDAFVDSLDMEVLGFQKSDTSTDGTVCLKPAGSSEVWSSVRSLHTSSPFR